MVKGVRCLKCKAELCHVVSDVAEAIVCEEERRQAEKHQATCGGAIESFEEADAAA